MCESWRIGTRVSWVPGGRGPAEEVGGVSLCSWGGGDRGMVMEGKGDEEQLFL